MKIESFYAFCNCKVCALIRMAYDTHSAATKGNREWQDKLLLVVCKAEEIMYSKANSEV